MHLLCLFSGSLSVGYFAVPRVALSDLDHHHVLLSSFI